MSLSNIFSKEASSEIINRIGKLNANTTPSWGKMNVSQMLAHCNVTYEMCYENKHAEPNFLLRFILKLFVKPKVVGEGTYPKSSQTAPQFIIKGDKDFDVEKARLVSYIQKTQELGSTYFEGKKSHSFGNLTSTEWNNMFYKHLDHHLKQFGV